MSALLVLGAFAVALCLWWLLTPPREDVDNLDDLDDDLTAWAHDWPTRWQGRPSDG